MFSGMVMGAPRRNAWATRPTFGTWSDYYNFLTTAAAGGPDPCIFINVNSSGNYTGTYTVNNTMDQQACQGAGGQWVAQGVQFTVNSKGVVVTNAQDMAAVSLANAVGNSFPYWTGQQYFPAGVCNAIKWTARIDTGVLLADKQSAPITAPISAIAWLLDFAGCP